MKPDEKASTFQGLDISDEILAVIEKLEYKIPTPIQQKAIPAAIAGKDILGIAQTGTGKTLAFGIPMIQRLRREEGRALILVPTRELALQVDATLRKLGNPFDIRSVIVIGGMDMDMQVKLLQKDKIRVIIATPGRLLDHLEKKTFDASQLKMVVLDEADRMLDMGFAPQIRRAAPFLPKDRQTLFFSATMSQEIVTLAGLYTKEPVKIEAAHSGAAPAKIVQELYVLREENKMKLLTKILQKYRGSVLIFTRTKASTWKLTEALRLEGHQVNELHSDRTQGQRRHALNGFKTGIYRILVATDIAARGIDVKGIELVINYDLPDETENYVHRIGRTGRAGMKGHAITFATPKEGNLVRNVETLMKTKLHISSQPGVESEEFSKSSLSNKKKREYDPARHQTGRPDFSSKKKTDK